MSGEIDYYAILGVDRTADPDEIRRAFRERVRACHPDRVANLDEDLRRLAQEKMVQLNEAYAVLRNADRRAAYDSRVREGAGKKSPDAEATPAPSSPRTRPPRPQTDDEEARDRINEQAFVARAATEEFTGRLKQAVGGDASWTPVALGGTTLALRASKGRTDDYFVMIATSTLDEKTLRRFLRRTNSWANGIKGKWWGRSRVFPFAGSIEFAQPGKLRRVVERYNKRDDRPEVVAPAALVDLVNWTVAPDDEDLDEWLRSKLR